MTTSLFFVCACRGRGGSSLQDSAPPLTATQLSAVQRLTESLQLGQRSAVTALASRAGKNLSRLTLGAIPLFYDPAMDVRISGLSLWTSALRPSQCLVDSNAPTSQRQIPESGYFYLVVDSPQCPLRLRNRVSVIERPPGSELRARINMNYTMSLLQDGLKTLSDVTAYDIEGEFRVQEVARGLNIEGSVTGPIVSQTFNTVQFSLSVQGVLVSEADFSLDFKNVFQFPDFRAEAQQHLQKIGGRSSQTYSLNGVPATEQDFTNVIQMSLQTDGVGALSLGL